MGLLYDNITDWDNLWLAFRKAARGKRRKQSAAAFEYQVADQLLELQTQLLTHCYQPGAYHHFVIHEPKRRKISAAPFRDRVVHHALCNVIEPIFERQFIANSFANRAGKGTHLAIDTVQHYARQYEFVLRMDIVQHFPSLDHAILRAELAATIEDIDVLALIDLILNSGVGILTNEYTPVLFEGDDLFALSRPRGLPIGNLSSQFWSNVYMNPLDWFIKRELGCNAYVRYVDDFALFSNSQAQLQQWRSAIILKLAKMRLVCHENEAWVIPTPSGIPWLGFVVYPSYRKLKKRNVLAFTKRLKHNLHDYGAGNISFAELDASVQGWIAHVVYADTWGLRKHLFASHPISVGPK